MRNWFKKQGDTPRLLSLSPLRTDSRPDLIPTNGGKLQNPTASTHRSRIDTSPRIWPPNINSSPNDTHLYNVEESVIVVERKSDRKRPKSQPRYTKCDNSRLREKRNPLLDRVKHTRLSCFKSPPINLNATEEQAAAPETPSAQADAIEKQTQSTSLDSLLNNVSKSSASLCFSEKLKAISEKYLQPSTSRFLAKLYKSPQPNVPTVSVKSSSPVRRSAESRRVSSKLRSFSYGALPGLEEFHKSGNRNPLYKEDDVGLLQDDDYADELDDLDNRLNQQRSAKAEYGEDDSDSGILVSGESTCSSGSFRMRSGEDQTHPHYFDRRRNAKRAQSLDRREIAKKMPNVLTPISMHVESEEKSFISVRIDKTDADEDLGIVMTRKAQQGDKRGEYVVTELVPGCLAHSLGTVLVDDEIVHVNGRRVTEEDVSYKSPGKTIVRLRTSSLHVHIMLLRSSRPWQQETANGSQENGIEIAVSVQTTVEFDHIKRTPVIIAYGTPPVSHKHFQKKHSTYNSRNKMSSRRGAIQKSEPPNTANPTGVLKELEVSLSQSEEKDAALEISFRTEEASVSASTSSLVVRSVAGRPQKIVRRRLAVYATEEEVDDDDDDDDYDDGYAKVQFNKEVHLNDEEDGYATVKFKNKEDKLDGDDDIYATVHFKKDEEQLEKINGPLVKTSPKKRTHVDSQLKPFEGFLVPHPPTSSKSIFTFPLSGTYTCNSSSTSTKSCACVAPSNKRVSLGPYGFPILGSDFAQSLYDDPIPSTSAAGLTYFSEPATSFELECYSPLSPPLASTEATPYLTVVAEDEYDTNTSLSSLSPITESPVASLSGGESLSPMVGSPVASGSEQDAAANGGGSSNFCTLPRRPQGPMCTYFMIELEKGSGRKPLGFGIVGGSDSPKGALGIYISSLIPGLQAFQDGRLKEGDEILAINGTSLHNFGHDQALQFFKDIKTGPVALQISRRANTINKINNTKAKSCNDLAQADQDDV